MSISDCTVLKLDIFKHIVISDWVTMFTNNLKMIWPIVVYEQEFSEIPMFFCERDTFVWFLALKIFPIVVKVAHYRPQWSCGKVMFLHLSVILFTGGGCAQGGALPYPPGQIPAKADTPTPWADTPSPSCTVHAGIRSTSGRYASY